MSGNKKNNVQCGNPELGKNRGLSIKNNDFIVKMLFKVTKYLQNNHF